MEYLDCPINIKNILLKKNNKKDLLLFLEECKNLNNLNNEDEKIVSITREFQWLNGYVVKYHIESAINAKRLQEIINKNNLSELAVPKSYVLKLIKNDREINNNNSIVIVEKIEGLTYRNGLKINLKRIKQLISVADMANHYDISVQNIIEKDKKLYIMNTDQLSMPSPEKVKIIRENYIKYGKDDMGDITDNTNNKDTINQIEKFTKYGNLVLTEDAFKFINLYALYREFVRIHLDKKFYSYDNIPNNIIQRAIYEVYCSQKKLINNPEILSELEINDLFDLNK